jgi:hypothetical protein
MDTRKRDGSICGITSNAGPEASEDAGQFCFLESTNRPGKKSSGHIFNRSDQGSEEGKWSVYP